MTPRTLPRPASVVATAALAISVLAISVLASACGGDTEQRALAGTVREPAPVVADLSLPDARSGAPVPLAASEGNLLVLYFGYTSCPDVCPTTLADLRGALDEVEDADRVEVAMATIDPARDTPEVITGYVQSFIPGATGLRTTDDAELRAAAEVLGVSYDVRTVETADGDDEIEVTHTGFLYAIDDDGVLRVTWPFGVTSDDLRADIDQLLAEVAP